VAVKDINRVVADNLAYWMGERKLTQQALAVEAKVSQKTISNYLNPAQRTEGSRGKPGSPKLVELDRIAHALGVELWQLTRQMTPAERSVYETVEKAFRDLLVAARQQRSAIEPGATQKEDAGSRPDTEAEDPLVTDARTRRQNGTIRRTKKS
jgi:transcriptional regulator with XRE-family HTH domain